MQTNRQPRATGRRHSRELETRTCARPLTPALLRALLLGLVWMALGSLPAYAGDCGGKNQRACCFLEDTSIGECKDGLTAVAGCDADKVDGDCTCGGFPSFPASSHCEQRTACGGDGQRACCAFEASFGACKAGLAQIPGCGDSDDCLCGGVSTLFPDAKSSGTCIKPTACGGKGQRACVVFETGIFTTRPCDEGLIEVNRCVGDCFGKGLGDAYGVASSMCAEPETIDEPTTNRTLPAHDAPTVASSTCPLYGYADMHLHLFADLAHGAGVLAGKPYDEDGGINAALQQCVGSNRSFVNQDLVSGAETSVGAPTSCPSTFYPQGCGARVFHGDHGIGNDAVGSPVGTGDGALEELGGENSNLGAPIFNGWPRWSSTTHQQAYYKWLERAWQGGLRLTTMLAVTNEALCKGGKHVSGTNCEDSMDSIDLQIAAAKEFEEFIDKQNDDSVDDDGWFKIVYTPLEARQAIAAGRLAVVLGIETAELFNCKFPIEQCVVVAAGTVFRTVVCPSSDDFTASGPHTTGSPDMCTPAFVKQQVQKYYDMGVRHVFPIHNFDNGFGASATWQTAIEVGNRLVENHWWFTEACPVDPDPYGFELGFGQQLFISLFKFGSLIKEPAVHPAGPSCNSYGLFALGRTLISELMNKGILIDVDHMSRKAFDTTLEMAESRSYPGIVASHVLSFDRHDEAVRHERMRTRTQLDRIRDVGGMIAAMLKDEVQDTSKRGEKHAIDYGPSQVKDDCRHSSKSFAQAFEYAVDVMQGPVALGSDFNGVAGHFGPRFGSDACGGFVGHGDVAGRDKERSAQYRAKNRLAYPFTLEGFGTFGRQVTGQRTFDYNVDGMAHVGLLPDFVADLKTIGMADSDLNMLFRSAEAYIHVWEGARQAGLGEQPAANGCISVTGHYPSPAYDNTLLFFSADVFPSGGEVTWEFGDGSTGSGVFTTHVYAEPGTYTVRVRATDPVFGGSAEDTKSLNVQTSNNTLFGAQIQITAPTQAFEGDLVPVSFQHSILWAFDEVSCGGPSPQNLDTNFPLPNGSFKCRYPGGPTHDAVITVTVVQKDIFGHVVASSTHSRPIRILAKAPSIVAADASIPWSDPEGGLTTFVLPLVLSDAAGTKLGLTVNWGDGSAPLSQSNLNTGARSVSHVYQRPTAVGQPYTVEIRVSDSSTTVTKLINVEVVGPPPQLTLSGPELSGVGRVESYATHGSDPDGGTVLLTQLSCGPAGTLLNALGAPQAGEDHSFQCEFTAPSDSNPVSATYQDDEGRKTVATRLVRIGSPPTGLLGGEGTAPEGSDVSFTVQGHATEGNDVTLHSILCGQLAPTFVSADLCPGPGCGAEDLLVNFRCRFPDGPATATVSATLRDVNGDTVKTLGVAVHNVAPSIASLVGPAQLAPGQSGAVEIRASDPGADPLTATINWGDGSSQTVPFPGSGQPGEVYQAGAAHVWTQPGRYNVTVAVADDDGGEAQQALLVEVVDNTPPLVSVPADITREGLSAQGVAVSFDAAANDDVDGPLPASCTPASGSVFPLGVTEVTCTATDAAGNQGSSTFSVSVVDTAPPEIVVTVSPDANDAGWHKDPPTVQWTLSDVVGVDSSTGCDTVTLADETTGTVVTCAARDAAGNAASKSVTIKLDRTAPAVVFGSASPAANANGWHKADVSVPFTISDEASGLPAGAPAAGTLTFSAEGAGLTQTVPATDVAGNTSTAISPAVSLDKTPPTIAGARSPEANPNGWNNEPVTVSFSCEDSLSGVEACSAAATLTGEGADQSRSGAVRDRAGNEASHSVGAIHIDRTPPRIAGTRDRAPNANNWYNSDVTVRFECDDALSGVAFCNPPLTIAGEGAQQARTGVARDLAGNEADYTEAGINIDETPPAIAGSRTPEPNANGWNNTDVTVSFNCADQLSGVELCSQPSSLGADGVGQAHSGTARDLAGNTATATVGGINIDKTSPVIGCSNSAPSLWPPNHKLVTVHALVTLNDGLAGSAGFNLMSVTSNEPDNGSGDGDTAADIQGFALGRPDTEGQLRAERAGGGNGRIYSIVYEGKDAAGNRALCTTAVSVPHDNGGSKGK